MKCFIAFVVLVAVAQAMPPTAPPINEDCIRETGVQRDQVSFIDIPKLEASKELRCYRRCVDLKDDRIKENNMPNFESKKMMRQAPPGAELDRVKAFSVDCQKESAGVADKCDNYLAIMKCMTKKFVH